MPNKNKVQPTYILPTLPTYYTLPNDNFLLCRHCDTIELRKLQAHPSSICDAVDIVKPPIRYEDFIYLCNISQT